MWNDKDKQLMSQKGIDESMIEAQLKRFETGFPWLKLEAVATVGNGITRLDAKQQSQCIKLWKEYQGKKHNPIPTLSASSLRESRNSPSIPN